MHIIIPHFTLYPLISQKKSDFLLWSKVVEMLANKDHLNQPGFLSILSYYASINRGVSPKVQSFHPNIIPQPKPVLNLPKKLDPYWVSGFVAGLPLTEKHTFETCLNRVSYIMSYYNRSHIEANNFSLDDLGAIPYNPIKNTKINQSLIKHLTTNVSIL